MTEEGFKRKIHTAKPEVNEASAQFIARLSNYFSRWLDFSGIEKTFEALKDLMVREQYLDACTVDLAVFLRERALTNLADLAEVAQKYLDAHIGKGHPHKMGKADEKPSSLLIEFRTKLKLTKLQELLKHASRAINLDIWQKIVSETRELQQ